MSFLKRSNRDFEEKVYIARISVLRNSLETIAKMDYRKEGTVSGRGEADYELIARMMKAQARLALDIESNLSNKKEEQNE